MTDLRNQTVLITGGGGGIGRAAARRLIEGGARGAMLDICDQKNGGETATAISPDGKAWFLRCDVSDRTQVELALGEIVSKWKRLDVAIANAAIVQNQPFLEITPEAWTQTLKVNLDGCFH